MELNILLILLEMNVFCNVEKFKIIINTDKIPHKLVFYNVSIYFNLMLIILLVIVQMFAHIQISLILSQELAIQNALHNHLSMVQILIENVCQIAKIILLVIILLVCASKFVLKDLKG